MKNIIFLLSLLILWSCGNDSIQEYNSNPNAPEVAPTNAIFNSATQEWTTYMRGAFGSGRLTLPWMQYVSQTAYGNADRYAYADNVALAIYQSLNRTATDFKAIIDLNSNEDTRLQMSAYGNNENQIAASRIMLSYMYLTTTDFFGDIPYYSYGSDDSAFQGLQIDEFLSPVFAPQEKIYPDIINELREAADMLNTLQPVFTSGDNIYNGDATLWKKFANSLILRTAMRISGVNPGLAESAIAQAVSDGVFTSNADNAVQAYPESDNLGSPFYLSFIGRTDHAVCATFVSLMKGELGDFPFDPRLFEIAAPISANIETILDDSYERSEDPDDYIGIPYAFEQINLLGFNLYSFPSSKILSPTYGEVLMEYAEVAFILSEANDWNQEQYTDGVRASMEKWGVPEPEIDSYIAALPAASDENVLNQKYIALFMQPHNAYAEYRRTGFPTTDILLLPGETYVLPPIQAAASNIDSYTFTVDPSVSFNAIPLRLRYPQSLQTLNGANRLEAAQRLENGDTVESKLYWDGD